MAMGDLIPYRPRRAHEEGTGLVGMIVFLASWAMMFAALFFAYGVVRLRAPIWPPLDQPRLPTALAGLNTLVLASSSVALQLALLAVRRGRVKVLAPLLSGSSVLGLGFLGLQTNAWVSVWRAGMTASTGPYASVFYGLTWFHALHVLVGVVALVTLAVRAAAGGLSAPRHQPLRLWTIYWHFVGVVWVILFITVYLV
jgi:cytochrome c oxidase subunit 3